MKGLINKLKKYRLFFKNIFKLVIEYVALNRLFLSYAVLTMLATCFSRYLTFNHFFSFRSFFMDLGIVLSIGAFGYFIKPKNQFRYFFVWLIIFTTTAAINSIYYIFYQSFASLGEVASLGQTETVMDSIFERLSIKEFLFILNPIIFYLIHHKLKKGIYYPIVTKVEKAKTMVLSTLSLGLVFILLILANSTRTDYSRLAKQWNRIANADRFGILFYQGNDIIQTLTPRISSLFGYEEAVLVFNNYYKEHEDYKTNKYTNILKDKNIIFIHMESIQDFLMKLEYNGEEVTPEINRLAREGMHFTNFYPQISSGTSSDTEFTLLSSLMPALSGTVFVSYYDRYYETLPKILTRDDYYIFSMHGNNATMWNRNRAHPSLGYQDMFYAESFDFTEEDIINLGINDSLFFKQGFEIIENMEKETKKYMGTVITLTNHSTFPDVSMYKDIDTSYTFNEYGVDISVDYLGEKAIGKYIKSSHYADYALGEFFNYVRESEYFNDTVFVLYGDHDAKFSIANLNYLYNYDKETGELKDEEDPTYIKYDAFDHELNKKTPLIIWTKNENLKKVFKGEVDYYMGMIDVSPTILNMMGHYNKYALGNDIFNVKDNNYVMFPNSNFLTKKLYYNSSTEEYKILEENTILEQSYIDDILKEIEEKFQVSNSIIVYDLIKKEVIDKVSK